MTDLVFEAVQDADGGFCAECLTENIFTQADTWDELLTNVIDATMIPGRGESGFTSSKMKSCRSHEAAARPIGRATGRDPLPALALQESPQVG